MYYQILRPNLNGMCGNKEDFRCCISRLRSQGSDRQINIYHHSDGVKVLVLIILPSIYK